MTRAWPTWSRRSDEARASGVLTDVPAGLAFRHPLIREALYAELPEAVRSAWHRDAGQALAAAGAPPDRVARQLLRSIGSGPGTKADKELGILPGSLTATPAAPDGHSDAGDGRNEAAGTVSPASALPIGQAGAAIHIERPPAGPGASWLAGPIDEWMLEWLVTSAESLVGRAPGVAAELLGQAVAGIPSGSFRHGWLASRLADALYRTGERALAEEVATRALAHATDPDLLVDLHWTLAQCRMLAGKSEESFATLDDALAAPGITPKHRARLLVLAARTYLYFGEMAAADSRARQALNSASQAGDTWATGWSLHVLALAAKIQGDMAGALPLYDRGLSVTDTDPALTDLGLLLQINKAIALFTIDHCDEGLKTAERAQQLADQVGTAMRRAQAHGALSQALHAIGRWDDALAELAVVPEDLKEPVGACCELGIAAEIRFHRNRVRSGEAVPGRRSASPPTGWTATHPAPAHRAVRRTRAGRGPRSGTGCPAGGVRRQHRRRRA